MRQCEASQSPPFHASEYVGGTSANSGAARTCEVLPPAPDEDGSPAELKRIPESAWNVAGWGTDSSPASAALLIAWFGLSLGGCALVTTKSDGGWDGPDTEV